MTEKYLPIFPSLEKSLPSLWEPFFEAVEDGVCVQLPDTRIAYANRAFTEMMGLSIDQVNNRFCADVFGCQHEEGQFPPFCARRAADQTGRVETEEIYGRHPDQLLRARVSPVKNEQGETVAYVIIVRDITDIAAHERELARIEHLARFGELAAGLAHEIKNPLAGIQGAVDILIQRREENDPERNILEGVRREVGRINNTVHTLLDRARPRTLKLHPASITETVQRAVNLARASLSGSNRQRIRLDFVSTIAPTLLMIDAAQLEDAVLNLLLNAIAAIDGEGEIMTRISENDEKGEILIEVSDNGRGIEEENLRQIFNPFYTTEPNGTGLGLPAVRRIARAHGGRVEVQSRVGNGSTFSLLLPRFKEVQP